MRVSVFVCAILWALPPTTTAQEPFVPIYPGNDWKFRVNALLMDRSTPSAIPLVKDANGGTTLNASQFSFSYEAGVDLSLIRQVDERWDIELRCFGIDGWSSQASAVLPAATGEIATNPPSAFFGGPATLQFTYDSKLLSGEVNVGRSLGDMRVFAGFRMIELQEQMQGRISLAAPLAYDVNTDNRLYGFQAGAEGMILSAGERFRLVGFGKLGILGNSAEQDSSITSPPGTAFSTASARDTMASFLAETGLVASYRLSTNCSLRGGYQLLWLDNVALAPNQTSSTGDLSLGGNAPAALDRSEILYHGGFVGLEFHY